ncbi:MAG: CoA transferase [Burkholderiaceae bacterium]|nr:CoA transferase [Burkholderiaceae bacterium]
MNKPLEGVRVIDMSHVIAGPLASFFLAQLGAEVIKIESLNGGDAWRASKRAVSDGDTSHGFVSINSGKKSFAVDIRQPEGAEVVRELAKTADVFIENFRPGVVAKYGLDEASIRKLRSDIVYCSISGYGQRGPWAKRAAYDNVMQALTGMMLMSGATNSPPMKVGFPVIDVAAGMLGAMSVLSSLINRNNGGGGQYIDASMLQASLMLMYPQVSQCLTHSTEPERTGNRGFGGSPLSDTFQCADGWLAVAANTPAQVKRVLTLIGLLDLCEDTQAFDPQIFSAEGGGFVAPRDLNYVQDKISAAFQNRSANELEHSLNEIGVPAAKVRSLNEFLSEAKEIPELSSAFRSYPHGSNQVITSGLGFSVRENNNHINRGAPELGEDTIEILVGLGLDSQNLKELVRKGIIKVDHQVQEELSA